jgi:AraC-like DNA-binding protein
MIYSTSIQILNNSNYFDEQHSIFDFPSLKYKKSSLAEDEKVAILKKIMVLKNEKYFLDNMASLSGLAKSLGESSHHVSQVINEKLQKTFYEWLAWCRVEEAKQLLQKDTGAKLTIEDLADTVGYNSKSTFNKVFKQITSQTPSEYRKPFIKT